MDYEKLIKVIQHISFTTFLILCVAVTSYAISRLYIDSRADWGTVQINSQQIEKLDNDIQDLIERINRLLDAQSKKTLKLPFKPELDTKDS